MEAASEGAESFGSCCTRTTQALSNLVASAAPVRRAVGAEPLSQLRVHHVDDAEMVQHAQPLLPTLLVFVNPLRDGRELARVGAFAAVAQPRDPRKLASVEKYAPHPALLIARQVRDGEAESELFFCEPLVGNNARAQNHHGAACMWLGVSRHRPRAPRAHLRRARRDHGTKRRANTNTHTHAHIHPTHHILKSDRPEETLRQRTAGEGKALHDR